MRFSFLLALATLSSVASAQRGSPFDRDVARLSRDVVRSGRSPRAILPLLELEAARENASPGTVQRALGQLLSNRRVAPPTRAYAGALEALGRIDAGDALGAAERFAEMGYVNQWRVVGPFDNEGRAGFDTELPPEVERNQPAQTEGTYRGRERDVSWRRYPHEITRYGYVDFDSVMSPTINVCGFAETFVRRERAEPLTLWVGAGGAVKVWFNGEEVLRDEVLRRPDWDRSVALVAAREGWNRILVKVCVAERRWGFYLRVGDAQGGLISGGLEVDPEGTREAATPPENAPRMPDAPTAALAHLEAAVEADEEDADAHFDLARFLQWTGAQEPERNRARELAERAAELEPSVEHLIFASDLAETRAERMRFASQAEEANARDPRVQLLRAEVISTGPDPGRAIRMVDLPMNTVPGMHAAWMRATLLEEHGLRAAGMALIEEAIEKSGGAYRWVARRARALDQLGREEEALSETDDLLEIAYGDFEARRRLIDDAREREDTETMLRHLDAMRSVEPASTLLYAAELFEGLGREEDALDIYRQLVALSPQEASHHVRYGRALLRFGQNGAAAQALREALVLRPQDAETRQMLERLQPSERPDEQHAIDRETLLARRSESSEWMVTVLQDLTVHTVFENGLSSSFRQLAFQVHSDEGARQLRSYSVPFEPGRQWVDVRSLKVYRPDGSVVESMRTFERNLGDGRYRIYYDTRALVMSFPDLHPGDVVELRFRVEDVSRRNAFNDYFGDVQVLQSGLPVRHLEHIYVTPESRVLHFNDPGMERLRHTHEVADGQRVDRFVADDIPPLRRERNMPGVTEVAPYLHASTYESWEEMGRWWWGLAKDQLHLDASLEQQVAELLDGATTTREKVRRIYDWVVRNTRYVGLEFGIHGFKPYRVTQVVQRGFGDCKDTASLIYAMLTHAGIDARIALVRTSDLGMIGREVASLAAFNHAIAYVPELDLFLDGTLDTSGLEELPPGDQGALTLVVGPESAELRTIPVLPADRQRQERTITMRLRPDGSGDVEASERVIGPMAGWFRGRYEPEASREERLQEAMRGIFPGIEVETPTFENLDDFEQPVRFRYEGTVPQLATRTGDHLQIGPSTLGNIVSSLARTETRRTALSLGTPRSYAETRTLTPTEGLRVDEVPAGGEAESDFGRLRVSYSRRGPSVVAETELAITTHRVPPDRYPEFRQWVERVGTLLRQRVTFTGGAR